MTLARVRRRLLQAIAVVVFLALAGATYQGVATAVERRRFPHPGPLVDVGDHQLHLYCTGEGTPTVVLEAPAAGMSAAWAWVQSGLEHTTRVCSYDRAGLGWSEAGPRPFAPAAVSEDLQALLTGAGEPPPYILVGQGFGAALAQLHADRFGPDAIALVLIDPPAPPADQERPDDLARLVTLSPWLARIGVLRTTRLLARSAAGLPPPWTGVLTTFLHRPDHLTRAARELAQWDDTVALASTAPLRDDLVVARVEALGPARVAFLTSPETSAVVTAAIGGIIDGVRTP